jgi:hypothetical protein
LHGSLARAKEAEISTAYSKEKHKFLTDLGTAAMGSRSLAVIGPVVVETYTKRDRLQRQFSPGKGAV